MPQQSKRDSEGDAQPEKEIAREIEMTVWRDEQPGDDPTLHVQVLFRLVDSGATMAGLNPEKLELQSERRRWVAASLSSRTMVEGAFQVRAAGPPEFEAGDRVRGQLLLTSSQGVQRLLLPEAVVSKID